MVYFRYEEDVYSKIFVYSEAGCATAEKPRMQRSERGKPRSRMKNTGILK
ncbi:hypothetical protein PMI16_01347 [Herbaspirillum sp. CF444]|nr:hypothetical protein PMI16_01347 [Herbaspirillum sp. CF444]